MTVEGEEVVEASVAVPKMMRAELIVIPVLAFACGVVAWAVLSAVPGLSIAKLGESPDWWFVAWCCLLASLLGQVPLVLSKRFCLERMVARVSISIASRGLATVVCIIALERWGIGDEGNGILSFVAWYLLLLVADLLAIVRYITRLSPLVSNSPLEIDGRPA